VVHEKRRRTAHPTLAARTTVAASAALAATVVPVFLAGALSGPMGEELGFGAGRAGLAVTGFFVAAGIAAVPMSRLTPRLGPRWSMRLGITVSGLGCLVIASLARTWWHLAVSLVAVGSVVGLVDTAAASAFSSTVRRARQGLAFGIKEASVPVASMVAGVSVPVAAAWLGWRATFAGIVVLFPVAWTLLPASTPSDDGRPGGDGQRPSPPPRTPDGASASGQLLTSSDALAGVRLLALGIAAGAGAANAAATLLVPTVTSTGLSGSVAGALLAVASVASVAVRIVVGWAADRAPLAPVTWVAAALGLGAVGTAMLAVSSHPAALTAGAMLTLGAGWGWTGLAFLAGVRMAPAAPARAAGTVLTGLAFGGAVGPSVFAALTARAGSWAAWSLAAVAFLVGAAVTTAAGRRAAV
jgi:predicted MFS family arabinose efflux permease